MSTADPEKPMTWRSAKLNRWSMARTIRSGRKLDRPGGRPAAVTEKPARPVDTWTGGGHVAKSSEGNSSGEEEDMVPVGGKAIYLVSDGTGWTAEHCVSAALGQFERCSVDTHIFSGVVDFDRLLDIVKQAAKEGALLLYTLANPAMAESATNACEIWGVPYKDVLGPITEAIAGHLGASPSGLPRGAPGRSPLNGEYFKRIDCVEFTIKQDDGALPQNLPKADIVLAGVSRTGKTPLSIYLAQKGYKVANVPIVMGVELPGSLFEVDPTQVFGLVINPIVLHTIRRARAKSLGFDDELKNGYSEMDYVREELDFAGKIFAQNPNWPVIDVTGKAIEETAAVILRLYYDRKQKCFMPRIAKRY